MSIDRIRQRSRVTTHNMRPSSDLSRNGHVAQEHSTAPGIDLKSYIGNAALQRLLFERAGDAPFDLDDATAGRIHRAHSGGQPLDNAVQAQGQNGSKVSSQEQSDMQKSDTPFDIVAHDMAYEDRISSKNNALLKEWGFLEGWQSVIIDSDTGFFAGIILPHPDNPKKRKPIITFRGSADPSKSEFREIWKDWVVNDLNPSGVGVPQFNSVKTRVSDVIDMHKPIDMTGHSLGAALAQKFAALQPSSINRVVTFQSPGIAKGDVAKFQSARKRPQVTHHIAKGDLVDFAGEAFLPGNVYEHHMATTGPLAGAGPAAHMSHLLAGPTSVNVEPTRKFDEYPHQYRRKAAELLRSNVINLLTTVPETLISIVISSLYPSMEIGLNHLAKSINANPQQVYNLPFGIRSQVIRSLFVGATLDTAERAILAILKASLDDQTFVRLVDEVDAWELADQLDGKEYQLLRVLLQRHYYGQIPQSKAVELINKCTLTSKWQSEMVGDIMSARRAVKRSGDRGNR